MFALAVFLPPAEAAAATADAAAVAGARGAWGPAEWAVFGAVIFAALPALGFYGAQAWRALAGAGRVDFMGFGPAEAGVATLLSTLLLVVIATGFLAAAGGAGAEAKMPEGPAIVHAILLDTGIKAALVIALFVGLGLRGRNPGELFGFYRLGFGRVLLAGVGLVLAALPLVYAASFAAERLTGGAEQHGPEEAIRLLLSARDPASRMAMVGAAVVVAPVVEEFLFRGYLYGVMRRYLGAAAGTVLNAALFAGIHLHVPSLAPLFVFAVCLTLAYERTGSLLVPMTMHALFNALSVALLIWGVGEK